MKKLQTLIESLIVKYSKKSPAPKYLAGKGKT